MLRFVVGFCHWHAGVGVESETTPLFLTSSLVSDNGMKLVALSTGAQGPYEVFTGEFFLLFRLLGFPFWSTNFRPEDELP